MNRPKISVIVPVYNVEKYLDECLDSITSQTLRDIEIICVDDGSTDSSPEILERHAKKDGRIKTTRQENQGLGHTRGAGLRIASGEYILFCDNDDYYSTNAAFEKLYYAIKGNGSEVMLFKYIKERPEGVIESEKTEIGEKVEERAELLFETLPNAVSKIYKKSLFDRYDDWFFPKRMLYEDLPLHFQICLRAKSASFFDEALYFYRYNPKGIMNSKMGAKSLNNIFLATKSVRNMLREENLLDVFSREFAFIALKRLEDYFNMCEARTDLLGQVQSTAKELAPSIEKGLALYSPGNIMKFPYLDRKHVLFYKAAVRMDHETLCRYVEGKKNRELEHAIKKRDEHIRNLDELAKSHESQMKRQDKYIRELDEHIREYERIIGDRDATIRELKQIISDRDAKIRAMRSETDAILKSWSYRTGRAMTSPLSAPLEALRSIRDRILVKKSGLFDAEWYLEQNKDVAEAKADPVRHYLKFGWREGRNPSPDFDTKKYLEERPDVSAAGICPLVHYIKFGREK